MVSRPILVILAVIGAMAGGRTSLQEGPSPREGVNNSRPRIREIGVSPGILPTGPRNAVTDVPGVRVGHVTIVEGDHVRTGVTAIVAHDGNLFQEKVPAAVWVGNGFGKAAGFLQVSELGLIETPIVLTNTLSVGTAVEAVVRWTLSQPGNESVRSVNAVAGECNDGYLNDIRGMHVQVEHVIDAIERARGAPPHQPVDEGCVGAGTGTVCFGWKGGIGTSSRITPEDLGGWTVGVLVQSNFGGVLTIDGRRVGEAHGRYPFRESIERQGKKTPTDSSPWASDDDGSSRDDDSPGSCMIVVATNAPLDSRNLQRLAKRAILGLARTGSFMSNGSGDFVIAFSTANRIAQNSDQATQSIEILRNDRMNPLFLAVVEATEEAVYNSLTTATITTGHDGHTVEAIPLDRLREILQSD